MYNHASDEYQCPFCRIVQGGEGGGPTGSQQDDVVYRDDEVTAFVASHWWPNNPGHVLVVPSEHYENIYDLPPELGTAIQRIARRLALAFKATCGCDGVSTRQHNEPAGNQDVWHYHLHVFPRYANDHLYLQGKRPTTPDERRPYAVKLRKFLSEEDRAYDELIERHLEPNPNTADPARWRIKERGVPVWTLAAIAETDWSNAPQMAKEYGVSLEAIDAAHVYYQRNRTVVDGWNISNMMA